MLYQDDRFDKATATLREVVGPDLADPAQQTTLTQVSRLQHALTWNWRLPPDTPPARREALLAQQRRDMLRDVWTGLPNPVLDGKTPREAAGETAYRTRVLAAVLLLQLARDDPQVESDFDGLRQALGFAALEPIDPSGIDVTRLPLVRLARLVPKKLSDQELVSCYRRSVACLVYPAIRRLGHEIVARDSLRDSAQVNRADVYGTLARLEHDSQAGPGKPGTGPPGRRGGGKITGALARG